MLPTVLLHMVVPARPVDPTRDGSAGRDRPSRCQHMHDSPIGPLNHIAHNQVIDVAHIIWLPTRRRIKRGLVQHQRWMVFISQGFDHPRAKFPQKRIGAIQSSRGRSHCPDYRKNKKSTVPMGLADQYANPDTICVWLSLLISKPPGNGLNDMSE